MSIEIYIKHSVPSLDPVISKANSPGSIHTNISMGIKLLIVPVHTRIDNIIKGSSANIRMILLA